MKSQRVIYSLLVAAGLLAAVVGGLCLKYSPAGVMMSAVLAYDAIYVKLFENTPEEDAAYTARAVSEKDLSLCRKVSARYVRAEFPRQTCYREVVRAVSDPAICRDAEIMEYVGEDLCYALLAAFTGDRTLCERDFEDNAGFRDNCYYDMALARNEPAFCRKVSEPHQREYCLEQCAAIKKYEEKRVSGQLPVLPD